MKCRVDLIRLTFTFLLLLAMGSNAQAANIQNFSVPQAAWQQIQSQKSPQQIYIIGMIDDPVLNYNGTIAGLNATKPATGTRISPLSADVKQYVDHLTKSHDDLLLAANASNKKLYDYHFSFNGFAAHLTPIQAKAIANMPGVAFAIPDTRKFPVTNNSPEFLGLSGDHGAWDELGDYEKAGEDIIIGVIDTGAWPEHPSFSDQIDFADRPGSTDEDTLVYGPPPAHWKGTCQTGELWSVDNCNNKLIGARYFLDGFIQSGGLVPEEYRSARDSDGHGTHTASTAGGNYGVPAAVFNTAFGNVSGMAPRARIAVYKVCWNDQGCMVSDLTAAIDQAVADGVDVINYSIGSNTPSILGSDDIAFLFASDAGVFASVSAGNSGPGYGTIGSPAGAPWVTTVAASTQNRTYSATVTLGDNSVVSGASIGAGTGQLPLVDAVDAGSELCLLGQLDPVVVKDKIVLCKRGQVARVEKSLAVLQAGGAGMILYNASDSQSEILDSHFVPSIHINNTNGLLVKSYIAVSPLVAVAQISSAVETPISAPTMAAFSSRGANLAVGDIIKPDITAPGVNILAGQTPTPYSGPADQLFQLISGTSMSAPHIAGIAALVRQEHPDWSPAMIKSALMTTAYSDVLKEDGFTPADPFDMGAGHVAPRSALDPGLTYDAQLPDYFAFLCGVTAAVPASICTDLASLGFSFDPSDLNLASIGINQLAGVQTIERTVTNTEKEELEYEVVVEAPPGVDVVVTPSVLEIDKLATAKYTVTFSSANAQMDSWAFGSLTWVDDDGERIVRSPLAVFPVSLAAPAQLFFVATSGSTVFDVQFGYNGDFGSLAHGLIPAQKENDTVVDDPSNDILTALETGIGITQHVVVIPEGAIYSQISLFDEFTDGQDDLDLYLFGPDTAGFPFAGGSGSGTSAEEINLKLPQPGIYIVLVHGWQTDGPDSNYTLFSWALSNTDETNMNISAPTIASSGTTASIGLDWSGLLPSNKYLGILSYHDKSAPVDYLDGLLKDTIVSVDTY